MPTTRAVLGGFVAVLGSCTADPVAKAPPTGSDTGAPVDTADDTDTPPDDTGEDAVAYVTYDGTLAYLYGQGQAAVREYDCQLYWELDPTVAPTVLDDCPDCAFAFSVEWLLDDVLSRGSGGACDGDRRGDFVMSLGFRPQEDLPGTYTGYMLEQLDGVWVDRTMATFDATTGRFVFAIGALDDARDADGVTVFDSDQFYGAATVWDGSPRDDEDAR